MWMSWLLSPVFVLSLGDPTSLDASGQWSLRARTDLERSALGDDDCSDSDPCGALATEVMGGFETQWNPVSGLGVTVEFDYVRGNIPEAVFRGTGLGYGVGVQGTVPVNPRWWIAGGATWSSHVIGAEGFASTNGDRSQRHRGTVDTSLVLRPGADGLAGWFGARSSFLWRQTVVVMGEVDELSVSMSPEFPVSAVLGGVFRSRSLGQPWERGTHLTLGVEASYGQTTGFGTWLGLHW